MGQPDTCVSPDKGGFTLFKMKKMMFVDPKSIGYEVAGTFAYCRSLSAYASTGARSKVYVGHLSRDMLRRQWMSSDDFSNNKYRKSSDLIVPKLGSTIRTYVRIASDYTHRGSFGATSWNNTSLLSFRLASAKRAPHHDRQSRLQNPKILSSPDLVPLELYISDRGTHFCNDQFAKGHADIIESLTVSPEYHPNKLLRAQVEAVKCAFETYP
ncbi:hypothetical protein Tco_0004252 [Tanacetum coccineum]